MFVHAPDTSSVRAHIQALFVFDAEWWSDRYYRMNCPDELVEELVAQRRSEHPQLTILSIKKVKD